MTVGEQRWPDTPEFCSIAKNWNSNFSTILLGFVWKGYDLLYSEIISKIDMTKTEDELERSITQYLTPKIREAMTGYEPFDIEQGVYEFETRLPSPAQSPLYDIAFVLKSNERIMWPMEAKILKTDKSTGEYISEIKENFLTCRYAPFSNEGAMIGYMLSGRADNAFSKMTKKLGTHFSKHKEFPDRNHRVSSHVRNVPKSKSYPSKFLCHHLIMLMAKN